jgi:hypothetical protein
MPDSITHKDKIKLAKNDHRTLKYSVMGKLLKPVLMMLKWITKGAQKTPICSS